MLVNQVWRDGAAVVTFAAFGGSDVLLDDVNHDVIWHQIATSYVHLSFPSRCRFLLDRLPSVVQILK